MAMLPTGHVLTLDGRTYFGIDAPVPREDWMIQGEFKVYWCVYTTSGMRIGQGYRKHFQDAKQAIRRCAKRWHAKYKTGKTCDCCDQGGKYNGFHTGPHLFECPKHCACHD